MSSISNVGSSSSSNAAAVYQEYLARLQAQKQEAKTSDAKQPSPAASKVSGDTDHDGDNH
jgi:hypothetical protein